MNAEQSAAKVSIMTMLMGKVTICTVIELMVPNDVHKPVLSPISGTTKPLIE